MPLSERTKNYVQAFIREGNAFDHQKWLVRVRAEEAAKKSPVVFSTEPATQSECPAKLPKPEVGGRATTLGQHERRRNTTAIPKRKIEKNLKETARAWSACQGSRQRNAIYDYLNKVFWLVGKYQARGESKLLVRRAQKFGRLPISKQADAFTTVIRSTTRGEIDHRGISKYARALRYCRKHKGDQSLKAFMKRNGGINGCACRFSQRRRSRRGSE